MWRIIPVLVCVIYSAAAVCAFSAIMWALGLPQARLPTIYGFWTIIGASVLLMPVTVPFAISKAIK